MEGGKEKQKPPQLPSSLYVLISFCSPTAGGIRWEARSGAGEMQLSAISLVWIRAERKRTSQSGWVKDDAFHYF